MKKSKLFRYLLTVVFVISLLGLSSNSVRAEEQWISSEGGWWYQEADGSYPVSVWKKIGDFWYYFDDSGYMYTGWIKLNGHWFYLNTDGTMAHDTWVGNDYLNSDGVWTETWGSTGWQMRGGNWYYFNDDGKPFTGWLKDGRDWYYLNTDGGLHYGWLQDGGDWYYMGEDGRMCIDWIWDNDWYLMGPDGKWIYNNKIIYLTFDDGPGPYTDRLLGILDKYNVKATFFVTNAFPAYRDCIGRAYNAGHTIAVHSATHNYRQIYASEAAYWSDFEYMQSIVVSQTGHRTNLFRFPGGSSNGVSKFNPGIMTRLSYSSQAKGYVYFDWNVMSGDAGNTTSSTVCFSNLVQGVSANNVSVVLCHDVKSYTVDSMESFIPWALSNGYTFIPLTENSPTAHHPISN